MVSQGCPGLDETLLVREPPNWASVTVVMSKGPGASTAVFLLSGVVFLVREIVSGSSGIVANFCSTSLRAGRRMGLLRNSFMPDSMHSLTLLSSEKAVSATMGAE